jgi:hypothetical protein
VRRVGLGLIACTLPREEWTHEAHLAACAYIILERRDLLAERDLPRFIRRYNESVGGVNDATTGYHETVTQGSIRAVRAALGRTRGSLVEKVNFVLAAPEGDRAWLLAFYSRDRLFSSEARLGWRDPDLKPLP